MNEPQIRTATGEFFVLAAAYNLVDSLNYEEADPRAIVGLLQRFRLQIDSALTELHPQLLRTDFAETQAYWEATPEHGLSIRQAIKVLGVILEETLFWLKAEGFREMTLSVAIDCGRLILGEREAFGSTVTTALLLASQALADDHRLCLTREAATRLNWVVPTKTSWKEIRIAGSICNPRTVAFFSALDVS